MAYFYFIGSSIPIHLLKTGLGVRKIWLAINSYPPLPPMVASSEPSGDWPCFARNAKAFIPQVT